MPFQDGVQRSPGPPVIWINKEETGRDLSRIRIWEAEESQAVFVHCQNRSQLSGFSTGLFPFPFPAHLTVSRREQRKAHKVFNALFISFASTVYDCRHTARVYIRKSRLAGVRYISLSLSRGKCVLGLFSVDKASLLIYLFRLLEVQLCTVCFFISLLKGQQQQKEKETWHEQNRKEGATLCFKFVSAIKGDK